MAGTNVNPDVEVFLKSIEETENQANEHATFVKKLKARLSRTKKALKSKPAVAAPVSALISDLEALKPDPSALSVSALTRSLEDELQKLKRRFQDSFPDELRRSCEAANILFTAGPDGFGVGPFFVTIKVAKETAAFHFAKIDMKIAVPLNASAIVDRAASLKASLLDEPVDCAKFEDELNEAMRVALARRGNLPKAEWRVELPLVFREWAFIRQSRTKRRKSSDDDHLLCRFVIELKYFIQSDENMRANEQYRLETAVLENTKNSKKSIYIPRDMARALGEGTYYQTILLRHV